MKETIIFIYKDRKQNVITINLGSVPKKNLSKEKARIRRNKSKLILHYHHSNGINIVTLPDRTIKWEGYKYLQTTYTKSHISLYGGEDKAGMKFYFNILQTTRL